MMFVRSRSLAHRCGHEGELICLGDYSKGAGDRVLAGAVGNVGPAAQLAPGEV